MDKELRKLQNLLEGQEITSIEKNKHGMVRLVAENGYAMHIVPTSNLELENVYSTVRSSASKMVRTTLPNAFKKFKNKKL